MRIRQVALSGFRAFAGTTQFDLDADCVVISGANGQGKTSLLDGIFWALTGTLDRIGGTDRVVSLYSETGGASVTLTLASDDGDVVITRRCDGQGTSLSSQRGDRTLSEHDLRGLLGRFGVAHEPGGDAVTALAKTLARSLYLQQDSIRDFIDADSEDSRFRVVAELCGLGRVADLQGALQLERRNWSQVSNQLAEELKSRQARLHSLKERASRLTTADPSVESLASTWAQWWNAFAEIVSSSEPIPELGATASDAALDRAVRALDTAKRETARRREDLSAALQALEAVQTSKPEADLSSLEAALTAAEGAEGQAREDLAKAESVNLAIEQELRTAAATDRDRRALTELALRHLGETCPVCDQKIDRGATAERLQALLASTSHAGPTLSDLTPLIDTLRAREQHTLRARTAVREAEAEALRFQRATADLGTRLGQLGLEPAGDLEEIRTRLQQQREEVLSRLSSVDEARAGADQLLLSRARASELAQRQEVAQQLVSAEAEVADAEAILAGREQASRVAVRMLDEMREASLEIVGSELSRVEPLLQRIWAGIDPHPSLRAVNLISRLSYGKGRLSMRVLDDRRQVSSETPEAVLSSSQQNALAVALFLTLNLGTASLPLATMVLDDPFQSLDDINLLGLVDLLRRVRGTRQLVVTTHSGRFAQLLARKLRPVDEGQTTKLIQLDGWERTGPSISERTLTSEADPFRFVA